MAKHLTENEIEAIINIIDGWNQPKYGWKEIRKVCQPVIGRDLPTRQALISNIPIYQAYQSKKASLKTGVVRKPLPSSLKAAADRIGLFESKNKRLKMENRLLLEKFVVWQYNAYKNGLSEDKLNEPLPSIDRERTDGKRK